MEAVDASGKVYYWNKESRETRWDEPEILARQKARMEEIRQRQHAAASREAETRNVDQSAVVRHIFPCRQELALELCDRHHTVTGCIGRALAAPSEGWRL